ncbi:MAG: hypothetical protein LPK80_08045 [Bacteroidota bacterium]|nr:hypothetical protein [Bacteroidota bacterium]MDX5428208.1 hypothetical protein [Bacteroidota bacterium]MDX5448030.1 hypothetical protein [Bacteroidota bacterium]MDX5505990.1 hypothetical protein [Bacteroidota bacterium]
MMKTIERTLIFFLSIFLFSGCGTPRSATSGPTALEWNPPILSIHATGANGIRSFHMTQTSEGSQVAMPEKVLVRGLKVPFDVIPEKSSVIVNVNIPLEVEAEEQPDGKILHPEYGVLLDPGTYRVSLYFEDGSMLDFKEVELTEPPIQP